MTRSYSAVCPTCGNQHPLRGWAPTNVPYVNPQCDLCGSPVLVFGPPRESALDRAADRWLVDFKVVAGGCPPLPVVAAQDLWATPELTGTAW